MELSATIVVYNHWQEALTAAATVLDCTRRHPLTLYLVDNTLSDLAEWMEAHPDVVMARPGLQFPDGRIQALPLRRCSLRAMVYRQLRPCLWQTRSLLRYFRKWGFRW